MLFLSGMVAMIMMRALHKDFNRYNDPDNEEEAQVHLHYLSVPQRVRGRAMQRPPPFSSRKSITLLGPTS